MHRRNETRETLAFQIRLISLINKSFRIDRLRRFYFNLSFYVRKEKPQIIYIL